MEWVVADNNALSLPKGMMDYGRSASSLATAMLNEGKSLQEISAALSKHAKGDHPEGQDPVRGLLVAWGTGMSTVAAPLLLPSGATVGSIFAGGIISGTANVSNQLTNGPVNMTDALIATGTGAVTQGKGFWFTEIASITGAYAGAKLQGKDPLSPVIGAGIGNVIGAGTGKVVTDKFKPVVSGAVAEAIGAGSGAISSEVAGSTVEEKLNKNWSKK
ncbi:hypothetical protein CKY10_21940 [Photorhabdus sp. HUG-39]|uniref:Adhesin n=3 Tax=Morganellaceae TaxID=1903414 RepID=A0ABX0B681_9GAMM|nr:MULTISPECIES: hypothetical protein [Photorhabdus]MCC8375431.1 hypothetical protein [Photorhabdus bodei]MDB6369356.1 hypothetical protein [Photorhabdus bodei]NDL14470.1 hypothetical protein [Photorhabdus kayaii]NDL26294.1 hypothetical protein [Photorhabdus kayaii]RAX06625.1 hypothetical protein CKY10_21940 [Photorhabdus sp. HUG-39]